MSAPPYKTSSALWSQQVMGLARCKLLALSGATGLTKRDVKYGKLTPPRAGHTASDKAPAQSSFTLPWNDFRSSVTEPFISAFKLSSFQLHTPKLRYQIFHNLIKNLAMPLCSRRYFDFCRQLLTWSPNTLVSLEYMNILLVLGKVVKFLNILIVT